MNNNRKAITGIAKQPALPNIELALRVVEAMTTNSALFPNPSPKVEDLRTAAEEAQVSYSEAQGGSVIQRTKYRTDMVKLKQMLSDMCAYVNSVASGDENIIRASAFGVSKLREPRPLPAVVKNMEVVYSDNPGQALAKWSASQFHSFYILQVTTDPADQNSWKEVATLTARQTMVHGLSSGKRHFFRVIAAGTRGNSTPSEVATVMVA